MADTINLYAESDRNIIGDDSTPTLTLENSSTGKAIRVVNSGTGVAVQGEAAATSPVGDLYHTTPGAATVAVLRVTASTASAPFFEFKGFLASIASASSLQYGVRVKIGDEYGWIPVYYGGVYT
jgi:hypothetical protein